LVVIVAEAGLGPDIIRVINIGDNASSFDAESDIAFVRPKATLFLTAVPRFFHALAVTAARPVVAIAV